MFNATNNQGISETIACYEKAISINSNDALTLCNITALNQELKVVSVQKQGEFQVKEHKHPGPVIELNDVVKEIAQNVETHAQKIEQAQKVIMNQQGQIDLVKDRIRGLEEMIAKLTAKKS